MAVGLFLLFAHLGTLGIQDAMARAREQWAPGSAMAVAAAALLLAGACGKSAQLPLQTWLPDAMAGPTPVSALIHAATMVTAGVYLIARTHVLFELAPAVQSLVAVVGAVTLLVAGLSALVQRDIKRVLAYSTMSQVGYMFLALGVGAWSAGIFHFVTHAFFKSLLFLAAGVVIARLGEEHNMFRMGGLRKTLPLAFWTFLAGALALASLPPATAGFSKEWILSEAWSARTGGPWLFGAALAGVFITALYTFRMVFLTFFGAPRNAPASEDSRSVAHLLEAVLTRANGGDRRLQHQDVRFPPGDGGLTRRSQGAKPVPPPLRKYSDNRETVGMSATLILLAGACLLGGLLQWPAALGGHPAFANFLRHVFPEGAKDVPLSTERILGAVSEAASILGFLAAYGLFLRYPNAVERWPDANRLRRSPVLVRGMGFRLVVWETVGAAVRVSGADQSVGCRGSRLPGHGLGDGSDAPAVEPNPERAGALVCRRHGARGDHDYRHRGVSMILVCFIAVLLAGGLLAWALGRRHPTWPRWVALLCCAIDLALALAVWTASPSGIGRRTARCLRNRLARLKESVIPSVARNLIRHQPVGDPSLRSG